jgi:hypothetical protein
VKDRLGQTLSKKSRSKYIRTASLPNCPNLYKLKAASNGSTSTKKISHNDENPKEIKKRKHTSFVIDLQTEV